MVTKAHKNDRCTTQFSAFLNFFFIETICSHQNYFALLFCVKTVQQFNRNIFKTIQLLKEEINKRRYFEEIF